MPDRPARRHTPRLRGGRHLLNVKPQRERRAWGWRGEILVIDELHPARGPLALSAALANRRHVNARSPRVYLVRARARALFDRSASPSSSGNRRASDPGHSGATAAPRWCDRFGAHRAAVIDRSPPAIHRSGGSEPRDRPGVRRPRRPAQPFGGCDSSPSDQRYQNAAAGRCNRTRAASAAGTSNDALRAPIRQAPARVLLDE